jgi:hypothetical protein
MCRIGLKTLDGCFKQIQDGISVSGLVFYKTYGEIGLLPRINQSYSTEFKLKVVKI